MNVSDAVAQRKSIRQFLDKPVSNTVLQTLLEKAARAPSGGNVQPWRVFVLNGESSKRFLSFLESKPHQEDMEYQIYPSPLKEPYRSSRFKVGEDMYGLLGIPRDDKPARLRQYAKNLRFFDAPAAFFCFVDREMGPPQWSDLGMFLQTFMLLAEEAGLNTCAQESWAMKPQSVAEFVGAEPELMLFCGMAIGYGDPDAPVNELVTEREPMAAWVKFV
ncbi:MAG: nitroreductase [Pseudomonadota bacterium]